MPRRPDPRTGSSPRNEIETRLSQFNQGSSDYLVMSFPLARPRPDPLLTSAECAVLDSAAAGRSAAEIARERRTSRRTVENQLASGYRKVGVSNRSELTALWARKTR